MDDDGRDQFEKWISDEPYVMRVDRYPEDGDYPWPRQYRSVHVQLAWEAWQESRQNNAVQDESEKSPEMYEIVKQLATFDWLGEAELSDLVKRCREIVKRVDRQHEAEVTS